MEMNKNRNNSLLCRWKVKFLFLISLFPSAALIANTVSLNQTIKNLREQIQSLVLGFDENAFVLIEASPVMQPSLKLPETNVILDETVLSDEQGRVQMSHIKVTVLSELKSLSPQAESVIKEMLQGYSKNITFQYKAKLEGFEAKKNTPIQFNEELISSSISELKNQFSLTAKLMLATAAVFIAVLIYMVRQQQVHAKALQIGAKSLISSLGEGGGSRAAQQPAQIAQSSQPQMQMLGASQNQQGSSFSDLSDAGLAALISDAYWCEKDAYAAYVWRRLPFGRKEALLNGLPFSRDYVGYLSTVTEDAGVWEQHPYYLNPMPLWNFNNEVIAGLIQKYPSVLSGISQMRLASLPLPASDILQIAEVSEMNRTLPSFDEVAPSSPRLLANAIKITTRSDEDDLSLTQLEDVSISDMARIVSLAWALRIDENRFKDILRAVSALDLAAAWIGPVPVISLLERCTPERKLKIVKGYMEQNEPSRSSHAYERIHSIIIAELKHQKKAQSESSTLGREDVLKLAA